MPKKKKQKHFVHRTAIVEKDVKIGQGTKIWHFAQVREGTKIGQNCVIGKAVFIDFDSEIGNNVKIQNHSIIFHKAILEDGVFIGPNVCFTNDKIPRATNPDGTVKKTADWFVATIKVRQGATIGAHSVILPGVTIGLSAFIGAGSVVTKNVPDFALIFGNPAEIRGFVCRSGHKISEFIETETVIIGKCRCGANVQIERSSFRELKSSKQRRRIWLR